MINAALIFMMLVDLNYFFAVPALIILSYTIKLHSNVLEISGSALPFYCYTLVSLVLLSVGVLNPSINLLVFYLYIFRFYTNEYNECKFLYIFEYSVYIGVALAVIQFFDPELISIFRDAISNVEIQLVDYSQQSLAQFRLYGIFTNPNYFAFFLVFCLAYVMHLSNKFKLMLSAFALIGVILSGSRAGAFSYFLLITFWALKDLKARQLFVTFIIIAILAVIFLLEDESLRVLNIVDLFTSVDQSSSVRVANFIKYINDLVYSNSYIELFFGRGIVDNKEYYFDGDPGNLLYTYGMFGVLAFVILLLYKFRSVRGLYFLVVLFPFVLGGGVFGNLKLLFIFIFLPAIFQGVSVRLERFQGFNSPV